MSRGEKQKTQVERLDPKQQTLGRRLARIRSGFFDGISRRLILKVLGGLDAGEVVLVEGSREHRFGKPCADLPGVARIDVHDPAFYTAVAMGGILASGESYMDGAWSCDDLALLVRILLYNEDARRGFDGPLVQLAKRLRLLWESARSNTRAGSRRNIEAHYDLGNDLFEAFLDPTLTYSAGVFENPAASMEAASLAKYDRLCRKIDLKPTDHLLEVGCGWGGFALHAASQYGCRVTATTISREQRDLALERVTHAGLSDRIEVILEDYRDLTGSYDKLVSIEMIEAVGDEYFDTYFATCSALLAPHGAMALQSITIADEHYERARTEVDFIRRYIFPGGCLPSLAIVRSCVERKTDFSIADDEDITAHYAETLRRWRTRFIENKELIGSLGYPERFQRMWLFYLGYCEGGFEDGRIGTHQIVFAKPQFKAPVVR